MAELPPGVFRSDESKPGAGRNAQYMAGPRKSDVPSIVRTMPLFYKYFPVMEVNIVSGHLSIGAEKLPVIVCASMMSARCVLLSYLPWTTVAG